MYNTKKIVHKILGDKQSNNSSIAIQNYEKSGKFLCPWCGEYHKIGSKISKEHFKFLKEQKEKGY